MRLRHELQHFESNLFASGPQMILIAYTFQIKPDIDIAQIHIIVCAYIDMAGELNETCEAIKNKR
jgi:hypothetical protein